MEVKKFRFRTGSVVALLLAVVLVFTGVLYNLQVVNGSYYMEQSSRKIANTEIVPAARGYILDRYGREMVTNTAGYQVTLDPKLMGNIQDRNRTVLSLVEVCRDQGVKWADSLPISGAAPFRFTDKAPFEVTRQDEHGKISTSPSQLARLLEILKPAGLKKGAALTADQVMAALRAYFEVDAQVGEAAGRDLVGVLYELALRNKDISRSTYIFAENVDINFITAVKERGLAGVRIATVAVRDYVTPYAGHLLGQVGPIYAEDKDYYTQRGYSLNETVGKFGVESAFEDILRGIPGVKDVELSQSGKVVRESWHVNEADGQLMAPRPGEHVMLTIDAKLQEAVTTALERHVPGMTRESEIAACVITDMTGGILAMDSYPGYAAGDYYDDYEQLDADARRPLLNRALQGLYAPGSTFKPVVAIGGLEEGVITRTEEILDTGRYQYYDRIEDQPMCWFFRQYGQTHGWENVTEAIRDSCNIYFYETGLRMGIDAIDRYAELFGLGERTGLELYEEKGEIAGPETNKRHGQEWYEGETMYAAIGQGNTQITPIQLANYIATLVNGGNHYPTHLLKTVKSSDFSEVIQEYRPEPRDVLNLDPTNVEAVKEGMGLVASDGSAAVYFKDLPVKIGAKTGTAQVYGHDEANALLVAFAPYENPEIAMAIVVEQGGSGTSVAAIAADILEYYFSAKDTMDHVPAENTLIR